MKHGLLLAALTISSLSGQISAQNESGISFSGKLQVDLLVPEEDKAIGTEKYSSDVLSNTYLDLNLNSKYVSAGTRLELLSNPLPGYEANFKGEGIPYLFVSGRYKNVELTVGDYYEQFGSGLILRTYEERSLGIDNSLRGGRLKASFSGVSVKLLGGKQRNYWDHDGGLVYGGDIELNIDEWARRLRETNTYLQLGVSYVGKHEGDENIFVSPTQRLNLPQNVGSFDVRARLQKGNYSFLAEYAYKVNDPTFTNQYIYRPGSALLLSGSYSKKGLGALIQVKRSDNMSFRSKRSQTGTALYINHLPAFTMQQTYALAALYPYATQPDGEWAFQGELRYNFKRHSVLGGKYGTDIKLNYSRIQSIEENFITGNAPQMGTLGYKSRFFKIGNELYYQDINVEISKKISRSFKLSGMYMNQAYNQQVIEGEGRNGNIIWSNIFILEGKYQINNRFTLRSELQYLRTKQDQGDWMFGLVELSVLPYLMFSVSDMYNNGSTGLHYYMASGSFVYQAHRIQLSYGRTRAGFNCSGGVCRYVPASRGFQVSYSTSF